MIKPRGLKLGDTVGIIAPASPTPHEAINQSIAIFQRFGYEVRLGKTVGQEFGYLSGSDWCRVQDIHDMFSDPEITAIFCLRGGYGTPRILDLIDYDLIRENPKIFVGYSDITGLLTAIHQCTGLVTFHGPMIAELANKKDPPSWSTLFRHLTNPITVEPYFSDTKDAYTIVPGIAEGEIVGGNLSLLVSTLGTPYEIDTEDKILFIEDVGEETYSVDRMLTQLRLAGKLESANGIVVTNMSEMIKNTNKPNFTIKQVLTDILHPLGIPCFYGLQIGHCQPNLTVPIGVQVQLDATKRILAFLERGII
ncbi:LD-carboxypeptidase [Thermoflavimicrobium daqui]|uniref:LD-carboxypeptidase n=1 Tax=Thermoflavimicrobium daqui TaxID=2137476 RepID=A0A364K4J3_9BACL|nr:LD-carboxypeptidase [Thermoflavimicrobium daqui]